MAKLTKKEKATIERQMAVAPVRSETWVGIRPTIYKSGKYDRKGIRRSNKALCRNYE